LKVGNGNNYNVVYPNVTAPGVKLEKNVFATMRDGVKIALDVYRPSNCGEPCPVILAYSSFPKERIFESAKPGFYCPNGYI
jgi:predicted acyl esterase